MLVITAAFTGIMNTTIETVAYRPLRNAPRLAPLITAIGVSFILQTVGLVWKGPAPVSIRDDILPNSEIFHIGEADMHVEPADRLRGDDPDARSRWSGSSRGRSRARRCARSPRTRTPPR